MSVAALHPVTPPRAATAPAVAPDRTVLVCVSRPIAARVAGYLAHAGLADTVRVVTTLHEGLSAYRAQPVDVILHDTSLPDTGHLLVRTIAATTTLIQMTIGASNPGADLTTHLLRAVISPMRPEGTTTTPRRLPQRTLTKPLTDREMSVLRGMTAGQSNADIGRGLFISEDTVKTHARRVFRKLGAHDRAHAVAIGFRTGLLT